MRESIHCESSSFQDSSIYVLSTRKTSIYSTDNKVHLAHGSRKIESPNYPLDGLNHFLNGYDALFMLQVRTWLTPNGHISLSKNDTFGSDSSQQLLDPYRFLHFLHGVVLFFILQFLFKKFSLESRVTATIMMEGCREMLENSSLIIKRYRNATSALGYSGDSIYNSFGGLVCCTAGFVVA